MRFAAIAGWADPGACPVSFMCAQLGVSRSGCYAWRGAELSQREKDDCALIAVMRLVHEQARGNPGVRRLRAGLAALGHVVSHKRVHRLMQAAGLARTSPEGVEADHYRRGPSGRRAGPDRPRLHRRAAGHPLVR